MLSRGTWAYLTPAAASPSRPAEGEAEAAAIAIQPRDGLWDGMIDDLSKAVARCPVHRAYREALFLRPGHPRPGNTWTLAHFYAELVPKVLRQHRDDIAHRRGLLLAEPNGGEYVRRKRPDLYEKLVVESAALHLVEIEAARQKPTPPPPASPVAVIPTLRIPERIPSEEERRAELVEHRRTRVRDAFALAKAQAEDLAAAEKLLEGTSLPPAIRQRYITQLQQIIEQAYALQDPAEDEAPARAFVPVRRGQEEAEEEDERYAHRPSKPIRW